MDKEVRTWLFDVLNAIMEIESFFLDQPMDYDAFKKDLRTRRAIERNIEIIGEALSRIISKDTSLSISNARKIVDTRNRIIHGYDSVSDEIIWGILTQHLPLLETEVKSLLGEQLGCKLELEEDFLSHSEKSLFGNETVHKFASLRTLV